MSLTLKPMYWITGNYYDCRKMWRKICSLVGDPNIEVIECGYNPQGSVIRTAQASDIILCLKQRDIFDSRPRIIKLKGIPDDYAILTDYLCLANKKNLLVIDSPVGYRKPPSKRLIPVKQTKFYKEFIKRGELCDFPDMAKNNTQAIEWVTQVVKELGKSISPDAARFLVEIQGKNFDSLFAVLSKLMDYQSGKKISVDDVGDCTDPLFLRTVWNLLDDLVSMDIDSALCYLQNFYEHAGLESGTTFRGDIEKLLGAMLKRFNFYLVLKDTCGSQMNYNKIKRGVAGLKKRVQKMVNGKIVYNWDTDYFDGKFISVNLNKESTKIAAKWPWYRAYVIVSQIHLTRLALRTYTHINEYNRGGIKLLLDALVLLICGKLTPRQLNYMRGSYEGSRSNY